MDETTSERQASVRRRRDRRRRRGRTLATVALVAAAGQLGTACEPTCDPPFRAVAAEDASDGGVYTEPWPVTGTPRPPVTRPLDTDGDGVTDTAEKRDDRSIVVHRSTGDLVLTVPAPTDMWSDPQYGISLGDLDGDGRSDLVLQTGPRVPDGSEIPPDTWHVVSGTTPDGVHDLAGVAARPWPEGEALVPRLAGDVDGDGHDDIVDISGQEVDTTRVWSGADLDLTPGAAGPVAPAYHPLGRFETPVALDGRDALALQTYDGVPESSEIVLWLPEVTLQFTLAAEGMNVAGLEWAHPQVFGHGDDTWLVVERIYRTIVQRWAWDLDDPCAGTGA